MNKVLFINLTCILCDLSVDINLSMKWSHPEWIMMSLLHFCYIFYIEFTPLKRGTQLKIHLANVQIFMHTQDKEDLQV